MSVSDRELEGFGESFLQSFEAIRRALGLYPGAHPKVAEQLERFLRTVNTLHVKLGQATFNVANREFFINGLPLKQLSVSYARSLAAWEGLGLGLVRFEAGTRPEDVLRFFETLGRSGEEIAQAGGLAKLLVQAGIGGIRVAGVSTELASDLVPAFEATALQGTEAATPEEARGRFLDSKEQMSSLVDRAWETTSDPARMLRTAAALLERRLLARAPVAELLDRLRAHHEPSWRESLDGAAAALLMGRALGVPPARLAALGEAALLRDVGKLSVSREALAAPEGDEGARAERRRHPAAGARRLVLARDVDPAAAIVALEHHAGFNRRGYPRLGARRGLHPFSRVVAVADDYAAATGPAAGEARLLPAEALRRLVQAAGALHDPAAVRALLLAVGLFPEGTAVELRDGRYGVVAGPGDRHWLQPEVVVLKDDRGRDVEPEIVATSELVAGAEPAIAAAFVATRSDAERLVPLRTA